jgi:hypothetical protein
MDITLTLAKRSDKNAAKFQRLSFILAGVIFLINLAEYSPEKNEPEYFRIIYFLAYLIGGLLNLAVGFLYDKVYSEDIRDEIVRWFNSMTGLLLLFDSAQKFSKGKTGLPIVLFLTGLLYLFISFYWTLFKKRKSITISEDKIKIRKWLIKIKTIYFSEIDKISVTIERVRISLKNRKTIELPLGKNEELDIVRFAKKTNEINNPI